MEIIISPQHFFCQNRQLLVVVHGWDHRQVYSDGLPTNRDDEALEVPYLLLMLFREPDHHFLLLSFVAQEERPEEVQSPRVFIDPHGRLVSVVLPQGQHVQGSVVTVWG